MMRGNNDKDVQGPLKGIPVNIKDKESDLVRNGPIVIRIKDESRNKFIVE